MSDNARTAERIIDGLKEKWGWTTPKPHRLYLTNAIATALECERREAEQAQLDRDCAIVLRAPELYGDEHDARLRRAYAERLRDKATP